MRLLLIGISHRTAPVELRERLDFQARGVEAALRALAVQGAAREAVVLSTCNRAEVYTACDDVEAARSAVTSFLADFHGVDHATLLSHLYAQVDLDVARHLYRVAAGLDSMVMGEPQILGQVKEAHATASAAQAVGPSLNRLFHSSFAVGKRVRTETGLGAGAVSVGFAAVALARKIFGALEGRSVLVIGAGEMGELTARHMKSQGVHRITIVSRTFAHAASTAQAIGGASAASWEEIDAALAESDIVITATGAGTPVLTKARLETIMRPRPGRPLFIIDIAVPRDVEPAAGEIEQVFLYNVDDLQATVRENLARRASEVERAEAIVNDEVARFSAWLRARGAVPAIVALRQHFETVRKSELERLDFKLSAMPAEARGRIEEITRLIVEKLLLTPTEQLKALGDAETVATYSEAITKLFGIAPPAEPADAVSDSQNRQAAGPPPTAQNVKPFTPNKTRASSGSGGTG
jgi:glutamyl-tRNA reductase